MPDCDPRDVGQLTRLADFLETRRALWLPPLDLLLKTRGLVRRGETAYFARALGDDSLVDSMLPWLSSREGVYIEERIPRPKGPAFVLHGDQGEFFWYPEWFALAREDLRMRADVDRLRAVRKLRL